MKPSFRQPKSEFARRVFELLLRVPSGRVVTYGDLASASGHPRAARAVGTILHYNPAPDRYPCFRVVNRQGGLAADFAFGGKGMQQAYLEADGIVVKDGCVDLKKYAYVFSQDDVKSLER